MQFLLENCKTDCIQCDACKQWYHAQCEDLSVAEENAKVDECWIHGEDTLKCNTLFKKSKLSLCTLLTQRVCIDLIVKVTMHTFMYFGMCKERTAFVLLSRQVAMYVMTGLMSDSQILMVPPLHRS